VENDNIEVCPWCKKPPKADVDVWSFQPYVRCENPDCPVKPSHTIAVKTGTRESLMEEVINNWNSYKED